MKNLNANDEWFDSGTRDAFFFPSVTESDPHMHTGDYYSNTDNSN